VEHAVTTAYLNMVAENDPWRSRQHPLRIATVSVTKLGRNLSRRNKISANVSGPSPRDKRRPRPIALKVGVERAPLVPRFRKSTNYRTNLKALFDEEAMAALGPTRKISV
jgi:hypothetical protein